MRVRVKKIRDDRFKVIKLRSAGAEHEHYDIASTPTATVNFTVSNELSTRPSLSGTFHGG